MELITFAVGLDQSDQSHFVQTLQTLTTGQIRRILPVDIDVEELKGSIEFYNFH